MYMARWGFIPATPQTWRREIWIGWQPGAAWRSAWLWVRSAWIIIGWNRSSSGKYRKNGLPVSCGWAQEVDLPVVIHSRDAAQDTIDLMRAEHAERSGGVIHCYSYSRELARSFLDMGFYFGIGGVVTFKNGRKLKETVEYLPLDRILLETDSPYLSPVPHRGRRNDSRNLSYVVAQIARIKGITEEETERITTENALRLYPRLRV